MVADGHRPGTTRQGRRFAFPLFFGPAQDYPSTREHQVKFGLFGWKLTAALAAPRRALRRLRTRGAIGVVVDAHGAVLGTYFDPYARSSLPARLHGTGSPWVAHGGRAWEGFGRTHAAALASANRLRRRHQQLLRRLLDDDFDRLPYHATGA